MGEVSTSGGLREVVQPPPKPQLMFSSLPAIPNVQPTPRPPQLKIGGLARVILEPDKTETPQQFEFRRLQTYHSNPNVPLQEWEVVLGRMRYDQLCYGMKY
jgi:hypothetical protein